jgi:hypothetical protein
MKSRRTKASIWNAASRRGDKTFNQESAVFSGQKAAVAHGLKAFGGIRNGGVETIADPSDRGETFVRYHRPG